MRSVAAALPADRARALFSVTVILGLLAIVRLIGLRFSVVDLFVDEAQYWSWSRDLSFGYFSKPPLLPWIIFVADKACGSAEPCIRAPAPIFYFATCIVSFFIGKAAYDEETGYWAALLTGLGTGVVFSARIISTDVPLLLFWSIALYSYQRLLARPNWTWASVLGLALGLGLLAKYAMIYFVLGMFLAAVWSASARTLLGTSLIWLALGIAAIMVLPNLVWNLQNGLVTFKHTGGLIQGDGAGFHPVQGLEFLAAQFGVFGPVVFAVLIVALVRFRRLELSEQDRVMIAFALPPLILVVVVACVTHAYANWAAPAVISATIFAAAILVRRREIRWLRFSVFLGAVAQGALLIGDSFATDVRVPFLANPNPYSRTIGWRSLAEAAGTIARDFGAKTIAAETRYDVAAMLYYWRDQPEHIAAWQTEEPESFDLSNPLTERAVKPIILVTVCPFAERFGGTFHVQSHRRFDVSVGSAGTRVFHAFELTDYDGPIRPLAPCKRD